MARLIYYYEINSMLLRSTPEMLMPIYFWSWIQIKNSEILIRQTLLFFAAWLSGSLRLSYQKASILMVRSGFSLPPPSDLTKRTQRGYKTCEPIFRSSLSPLYFPLSLYFIYFLFVFFFLGGGRCFSIQLAIENLSRFFSLRRGRREMCDVKRRESLLRLWRTN